MRGWRARAGLCALAAALCLAAPAQAAPEDPLEVLIPEPPPPAFPSIPPPTGYLNGACGVVVAADGSLYVSDQYHDAVDVFGPSLEYASQLQTPDPCALALGPAGDLYVAAYHGGVAGYGPAPGFAPGPAFGSTATGIAVDPGSGNVFVDERDRVTGYLASGAPAEAGGDPLVVGEGSLGEGFGLALSEYPGTVGRLYVPDAADGEVEVFDPAVDAGAPVQRIAGPPGGFASLRDSAVAVDRVSGEVYVLDRLDPPETEQPQGTVQVFSAAGAYEGHLKYNVVHGSPSGLAVDNSAAPRYPAGGQGRVFVTTGNSHHSGVYVYPPGAATAAQPLPAQIPLRPLGGGEANPGVAIGAPAGTRGGCEGDDCQLLPPVPEDPILTTLIPGVGNPRVRFRRAPRNCRPLARAARRAARAARRTARAARENPRRARDAAEARERLRRARRATRRCRQGNHAGARASRVSAGEPEATAGPPPAPEAAGGGSTASSLAFEAPGLDAAVVADGGDATLAGSHPYQFDFGVSFDQGGGTADLRQLEAQLPPGLLVNPAVTPELCSAGQFAAPRSSPYEASASGESCPARTQVGVVEVETGLGGGETRRFGLFNLKPSPGTLGRFGAAPFGHPLVLDLRAFEGGASAAVLEADEVPGALQARAASVTLWGAPWDAGHDGERGDCLNEPDPGFAWGKCSVGEPIDHSPLAMLTLPAECGAPPSVSIRARAWQGAADLTATIPNRGAGGEPAPLEGCGSLGFDSPALTAEGVLSVRSASTSTGFAFDLTGEDPGLTDPRTRARSPLGRIAIELPDGVTLNPSLGAGLIGCTPAEYAAETAESAVGEGCPDGAKIGEVRVRSPFYEGVLRGAVYLAQPRVNPFGSLIAVYAVAKSADRGFALELPGQLLPDRRDGTLTMVFDDLPPFAYSELQLSLRTGQRAPLISPAACGPALTRIVLSPLAAGVATAVREDGSTVETGIGGGPCPDGPAPFSPQVRAGGVNSAVGAYTPYFIRLTRADTEQEIVSYSLVLPAGVTGKLAGIPPCPEAAIAAARTRSGAEELASPSCPQASRVGRTVSGYGIGSALTYAEGSIYLAGPYGGRPLSLVTINSATVGPFDLGTVVIRSALAVDPRTAQLSIDSSASDPIPHSLEGVPLHLREVRIFIDRPEFTRNPTGCEASQLTSTLTGAGSRLDDRSDDSTATVSERFQLLDCTALEFRPHLGLRLRGGVRRGAHPAVATTFRPRPDDASLKRIAVTMPPSLFLAQDHIREVCTRVQFAADRCPAGSVYGRAALRTPLFDEPMRGLVYLRSSDNRLPDLVALLHAGAIQIELQGRIGPSKAGGIRAFFDGIPDAPVERFTLWLSGGRQGLLVNSVNVCKAPPRARVKALAHNNRGVIFTARLRGECGRGGRR